MASIKRHLQRLQTLTAGDSTQSRLFAVLQEHIAEKLHQLRETIDLRRRVSFEAAQAVVRTAEGKRTMRLDGLRILAVDDQPDTLEVIETILVRCDAAVRTCGTAAECLAPKTG